jgi:nuclear pore complex protein Nup155
MQGVPPAEAMDRIQAIIVPLGQRFHGSESSFPFSSYCSIPSDSAASDESAMTEHIARLLVEFQLANADAVPPGWVVRVLARCGIPYVEVWDVFHQMYESQVRDVMVTSFYRVGFSLILDRFPRSVHNRLFKYSRPQSACFSRIG